MEMTLKISGQDVTFKKTGATMLLYKRLFGREYFADLAKIIKAKKALDAAERAADTTKPKKGKKKQDDDLSDEELTAITEQLESIDLEVYYNILYVLAKAADSDIPDQMTWLAGFDDFDVIQIFNVVSPMLSRELSVDPKNASPAAAGAVQEG